jgi:hypothetical protein
MMMAYIASTEAEVYGMIPKAPFVGATGQFETDKEAWDTLNKVPRSYVQYDPVVDTSNGQTALPPPARPQFTADIQTFEIGKESWRRSIQASMGIMPLPTAAQRQNEKSGVALDKIQTQQSVGAYHFTANFKISLEYAGRQLNDLITKVMDTERHIGVRGQDEQHSLLHVLPGAGPTAPPDLFDPQKGEFDTTISTGPSYQSQREEQSAFVDLLVQNLKDLPQPGTPAAKLLALAIRMKNLGPIADEIADFLDPQQQEQIPPQVQAQMSQLQQHAAQATQVAQQLMQEKQGKVWETQGKLETIKLQSAADMALEKLKLENQLTVAEINTKAQSMQERMAFVEDMVKQLHGQSHDIAMQKDDQAHQQDLAAQQAAHQADATDQQAANQSAQSAQDAAQQQQAAEQAPQVSQ